eukprot:1124245-Amphidinium_carterae.1
MAVTMKMSERACTTRRLPVLAHIHNATAKCCSLRMCLMTVNIAPSAPRTAVWKASDKAGAGFGQTSHLWTL